MGDALAYLLTCTTYGTWLPGEAEQPGVERTPYHRLAGVKGANCAKVAAGRRPLTINAIMAE